MIKCGGVIFYIINTSDWFRLLKLTLGSNLINFHYNSIVYLTIRKLDIPITNDLEKNDMYHGTLVGTDIPRGIYPSILITTGLCLIENLNLDRESGKLISLQIMS